MRRMHRTRALMVVAVALIATATSATPRPVAAGGSVLIYPADCPASLQSCVDDPSASTVYLATDAYVGESIEITRDLLLGASGGFTPAIRSITVSPASTAIHVVIERLTVREHIDGLFIGSGGDVTIRDSKVGTKQSPFAVSFL